MRLPIATWDVGWQRVAAGGTVVVLLAVALGALSVAIGFPDGYAAAQSAGADELFGRSDWADLRRGAGRDIVVFVPAYVVLGIGAALVVASTTGARAAIVGALLVGAVADLVETLRFRRSLGRLIAGGGIEDIEQLTQVTQVATYAKFAGLLAAAVLLVVAAARGT